MMQFITKTQYIEYLECSKNAWLRMYKPELFSMFELSDFDKNLLEQGNVVDTWSRLLFPNGVMVSRSIKDSVLETSKLIKDNTPVLFQPTFVFNGFLARNDILEYDKASGNWNLYEVKSTSSVKENSKQIDHIEDASFQSIVLKDSGLKINRVFIVCLDKKYIRQGKVNSSLLFNIEDVTSEVYSREETTRQRMEDCKKALLQDNEQALECLCVYKGRSAHCTTFSYSHPEITNYSVHDICNIGKSKPKLSTLIENETYLIENIPEDFNLSENQNTQVQVHKLNKPLIDSDAIKKELDSLVYPLYFFDYETYPSAIPLFDGFFPYQHIPFQFSLHIVSDKDKEPEHFEYLSCSNNDPSLEMIKKLEECIGSKGTVIAWHMSFERDRTLELAQRHPEHAVFLKDLCNRLYDLEDIFKKRYYVHPDFRGRTSIKKVLPVLAPELSYADLDIKEGGAASQKWYEMCFGNLDDENKEKIANALKKYCGLDTYAMYAIWRFLIRGK